MNYCPYCHATARSVLCTKCKRNMGADCSNRGEPYGLCYDEQETMNPKSPKIYAPSRFRKRDCRHNDTTGTERTTMTLEFAQREAKRRAEVLGKTQYVIYAAESWAADSHNAYLVSTRRPDTERHVVVEAVDPGN